ncbi:MAG TPA: DUF899 family protein [Rhizomicrobium sp.]|jgi:predicted dithiol-disulfide oxidoreductase (DUF899 family)
MSEISLHSIRFPNETAEYREARNELLLAERDLRRQMERVAAQRRALPLGGEVREDYVFEEDANALAQTTNAKPVKLSELFGDKTTLLAYSFMYGPAEGRGAMERPCPNCTSILDGLNGQSPHVSQRAALVVIAKSPIARIREFARGRGWSGLRLLSSAGNSYNADYRGENEEGAQRPALNVFTRRDGRIFHSYCTELMLAPSDPGQHPRHVDTIWPLWNLLDLTPEGRGNDWQPRLSY